MKVNNKWIALWGLNLWVITPSHASPSLNDLERAVWSEETDGLDRVEQDVAKLLQKDPHSSFAHYLMAYLYIRMAGSSKATEDLLQKAVELAEQAIDLAPREEYGYAAATILLDYGGRTNEALSLLGKVKKSGVKLSWRTKLNEYRILSSRLPADELVDESKNLLEITPAEFYDVSAPFVCSALSQKIPEGSFVALLKVLNKSHESYYLRITLADTLAQVGRYQEASREYALTQEKYPHKIEPLINQGIVLNAQLHLYTEARQKFLKAQTALATHAPSERKQHIAEMIFFHLGVISLNLGNSAGAIDQFVEALKVSNDSQSLTQELSGIFAEKRKESAYRAFLTKAIIVLPGKSFLYALLAESESNDPKLLKDALQHYQDAIILSPERGDFRIARGLTFFKLKQYQDALQEFSEALRLDPNDPVALYNKACALVQLGQINPAFEALTSALVLNPNLKNDARSDKDLLALWGDERFRNLVGGDVGH